MNFIMRNLLVLTTLILAVTYGFPTFDNETNSLVDACPEDSVLVNGNCECDYTLCKKPQCNEALTQEPNRTTGLPGNCCPIYTCGLCTQESIDAGQCMCAVGAILSINGTCDCTNPEKSLVDGVCICDSNKCPPHTECDDKSVAVSMKSECCASHVCTTCPEDSYPLHNLSESYSQDIVEDKCVCYPCAPKECPNNKTASVFHKGSQFPGECCDLFVCDYRNCTVGEKVYMHDELIYMNDEISRCQNGILIQQQGKETKQSMHCLSGDTVHAEGSTWMEDECTQCTCSNGLPKCIAGFCESTEIVTRKPKCKATHCTRICPQGFRANKDGCLICKCIHKSHEIHLITELSDLKQYMSGMNLTEEAVINKLKGDKCSITWIHIVVHIGVLLIIAVVLLCLWKCFHPKRIITRNIYEKTPLK